MAFLLPILVEAAEAAIAAGIEAAAATTAAAEAATAAVAEVAGPIAAEIVEADAAAEAGLSWEEYMAQRCMQDLQEVTNALSDQFPWMSEEIEAIEEQGKDDLPTL